MSVLALLWKRPGVSARTQADIDREKQIKPVKVIKAPPEFVVAISLVARRKAALSLQALVLLSVWAGLFLSLGGAAALTVAGGIQYQSVVTEADGSTVATATQITIPSLPKVGLAAVFPVGIIFIFVLGGELFTGNVMVMSLGMLTKRISLPDLVVSWVISFFANYAGTVLGALAFWGMGTLGDNPYHAYLSTLAAGKVNTNFGVNLLRGIPANFLVCIAVTMSTAADDMTGKILAIWWPIFTFVVAGFEHCIADMFFVTLAAFYGAPFSYGTFIWQTLIPVTIGNIIGGVLFMSFVLWFSFFPPTPPPLRRTVLYPFL